MADPLTEIHNAIWDTLEASEDFTALVPDGNRFRLDSDAMKRGAMDGTPKSSVDPCVIVYPDLGRSRVICSSGTELMLVWNFDVRYADERLTVKQFPVIWAMFRAMAAAALPGSTLRSALTFSGATVVKCEFTESGSQYGNLGAGASTGWRTVWAYEVTIVFSTPTLAPATEEEE